MSLKKIIYTFCISIFVCSYSVAQIKIEKKYKMWESQFVVEGKSKICFAVSMPTRMSPKNLNRAESRIFVTFRPGDGVSNEISITNGYPFSKKSNVSLEQTRNSTSCDSCFSSSASRALSKVVLDLIQIIQSAVAT